VDVVTLGAAGGLQAQILTYGGILHRLILPTRDSARDLVLSLPTLASYVSDDTFQGALVGRFANRIANAQFELNGVRHRLTANNGVNHLHGGSLGFGKRLWRVLNVETTTPQGLWLGLSSPAGEEGYPGNLEVIAELTVEAEELQLRFEARCDVATPVNLTYHPYFNLSGDARRSVDEQRLRIPASRFLPVADAGLIPKGEIASVSGTPFDFRKAKPLRAPDISSHAQLASGSGYDHCWVLDSPRDCDAELHSPHSGITMTIHSEQPAIQFYGGQLLPPKHPGLSGVCLEPQGFPNAVNEPGFPSVILNPGDTYRSTLRYRFSVTRV
jgi:aldose 1-epimerase